MKKITIPKIRIRDRVADHLIQGVIVFASVLFALYINNFAGSQKLKKQKRIAMESIRQELQQNLALARAWNEQHITFRNNAERLLKTSPDSLPEKIINDHFFSLSLLTEDKTLVADIMTSTAWEAAQSTGIVSEFNYSQAQELTKIYELQNHILNNTLQNILNLMTRPETHQDANVFPTLALFRWHFQELIGQENLLIQAYESTLKSIE